MNLTNRLFLVLIFCLAASPALTWGQAKPAPAVAPAPAVLLTVGGEVAKPLNLTAADLAKLPHRTVKATEHDGSVGTFAGVDLLEILKLAGVEFGEHLRGKALALYVLAEAADHYQVVYALAELDPGFTDDVVIVADKKNSQPIDDAHGPLRIIAPSDKRPARWIRQLRSLTVRRAG
jgi:DMSO/TMAO reductase YedYZ molybdopterin-dependent catalytic subunit